MLVVSARDGRPAAAPLYIRGGRVVNISARDKTVVALYGGGTVKTWNLMSDVPPVKAEGGRPPRGVRLMAVSSDGGALAITRNDPNEPRQENVEVLDAATGVTKAKLPVLPSGNAKFSHDGTRLALMEAVNHADSADDRRNLLVYRASGGGAPGPVFRSIPAHTDTEFEFGRDGTTLVTGSRGPSGGFAVKCWSAQTGEPLPGPSGELRQADGTYDGFTRFGEFFMVTPPLAARGDDTVLELWSVGGELTRLARLRFAGQSTAALAKVIFKGAQRIRGAGPDMLVATLDAGVEVYARDEGGGAVLTKAGTKMRLVPPLGSDIFLGAAVISPDGRLVAAPFAAQGGLTVRVWDAATGLPLTEPIWHEAIMWLAFSADSRRPLTFTVWGARREWFCGDFAGGAPAWAARMSEALTGLRVAGGVDVERLPPEDHARARREFEAALAGAAGAGDEAARFLRARLRR